MEESKSGKISSQSIEQLMQELGVEQKESQKD
jgi:hypothetical protein